GRVTQLPDTWAFAVRPFDESRLPPHPILREHHLLSHIQEAPGGVEADKSQATGDQNHDAASSTGISTSGPAVCRWSASHTTVEKTQSTSVLNCANPQVSLKR